jgi:hypothetical protein
MFGSYNGCHCWSQLDLRVLETYMRKNVLSRLGVTCTKSSGKPKLRAKCLGVKCHEINSQGRAKIMASAPFFEELTHVYTCVCVCVCVCVCAYMYVCMYVYA